MTERNSKKAGVVRVQGSFGDKKLIDKILPGHDCVFHLGAIVGVDKTLRSKNLLRQTNLIYTKHFIDRAVQERVSKFVFASSSEIYGNSTEIPFRENSRIMPISEYARYKAEIEQYLQALAKSRKLFSTVLRFFNVYGPGQREDFVINRFTAAAVEGSDLRVNWDGGQTRCFTFIDDAVEGLILALKYRGKRFDIFNIGNNEETSIVRLAKLIIESASSQRSDIVIVNKSKIHRYDVQRRVPSLRKSKQFLGYTPKINLGEGIKRILNARN